MNIGLAGPSRDVLDALMFLEGASAAEVVRPVVERHLEAQATDPQVQAVLRARGEYRGMKAGRVRKLAQPRRQGQHKTTG